MADQNQGTIAWIAGGIVLFAGALAAIPKLLRAVVSTARMAVSVNDAMPVVVQLPTLIRNQDRVQEQHGKILVEIKGGVTTRLDSQDQVLGEIKSAVQSSRFTTVLKYHLSESAIAAVSRHVEGKGFSILIVDDEPQTLKAMHQLFGAHYSVSTASSAREAEDMIDGDTYVVVCDQRMPGKRGAEFMTQIHDLWPFAVRVLLTAYIDLPAIAEALNKGRIYYFLEKPVDPELLTEVLRKCASPHHHLDPKRRHRRQRRL